MTDNGISVSTSGFHISKIDWNMSSECDIKLVRRHHHSYGGPYVCVLAMIEHIFCWFYWIAYSDSSQSRSYQQQLLLSSYLESKYH